jgi:hypothetical protein
VLDVIDRDDVAARAAARGAVLRDRLLALARDAPDVIAAVRGRGLLLGVELRPARAHDSLVLRGLLQKELLGVVAAGWLLAEHRVRVLPTLSAPATLRIEPSVYVDDAAIAQLETALRGLVAVLRGPDRRPLLRFLLPRDAALPPGPADAMPAVEPVPCVLEPAPAGAVRVGFLHPFVAPEQDLVAAEPSLGAWSATAVRALLHRLSAALDRAPVPLWGRPVLAGRAYLHTWVLPVDAASLEEDQRSGDLAGVVAAVQEAVDAAAAAGCAALALGEIGRAHV